MLAIAAVLVQVSGAPVAKVQTRQSVAHILDLAIKILSYSPED